MYKPKSCLKRALYSLIEHFFYIYLFGRNPDCTASNGFTAVQFKESFCSGLLGQQENSLDFQCQKVAGWTGSTPCSAASGHVGCYKPDQVSCKNKYGSCAITLRYVWNGTPCGINKVDNLCTVGSIITLPNPM